MKKIAQSFSVPFRYEVAFTRGMFETGNAVLADVIRAMHETPPAKVLAVIDEGVVNSHPGLISRMENYFARHDYTMRLCAPPIVAPGGESAKNDFGLVETLLRAIHEHGVDRHAYLAAIGGGAVLDLAGFAAAIAHRGIRHIRIPTTVLAQNDSGVGVKNGVNYFGKKNFLGCFAPPVAVINDFAFLSTLDERDWRSGIAEAVKVGLIKDAAFFAFLERAASALALREEAPMEHLIIECARLHLEHIGGGGDPFEMGSSRPLDFGHWAAHKLEQMTGFRLRHGEAVAIGIALDTTYAHLRGMLDELSWLRVIRLLQDLGFELFAPELLARKDGDFLLLQGLEEFREHLGGRLTIMLLDAIGSGKEVHEMDAATILRAIERLQGIRQAMI
jgi:3-dehydroquinate synthase